MSTNTSELALILEGILFAAGKPMTVEHLQQLFEDKEKPSAREIRSALEELAEHYESRTVVLKEIASGFHFQVTGKVSPWLHRLWEERPPKYSRATLETLALIAYRQPITRAEIEDIRGVAVSSNIIRAMLDREWIRVVGHKDVPGKPGLYATTKQFLDYFDLKTLDELPALADIKDLDKLTEQLEDGVAEVAQDSDEEIAEEHIEDQLEEQIEESIQVEPELLEIE